MAEFSIEKNGVIVNGNFEEILDIKKKRKESLFTSYNL